MCLRTNPSGVMAGLVPAIHDLLVDRKTWMPGTGPGMTEERLVPTEQNVI
jgi:hypothetical protein